MIVSYHTVNASLVKPYLAEKDSMDDSSAALFSQLLGSFENNFENLQLEMNLKSPVTINL